MRIHTDKTLNDLESMDTQQVYDRLLFQLRALTYAQVPPTPGTLYTLCLIVEFIDEITHKKLYDLQLDRYSWYTLIEYNLLPSRKHMGLICDVVRMYEKYPPHKWSDEMRLIAMKYYVNPGKLL